jgi:nicotinate phosphoribosyltransferase
MIRSQFSGNNLYILALKIYMMALLPDSIGLYTDYYELTMAYGYFRKSRQEEKAVFDYFFRTNPFENGFTVFAGLRDLIELIQHFRYSRSDLDYLRKMGFPADFLDYLGGFSFTGTIESVEEGEIVFPGEPLVKISGNLIETQLIESLVLNILNFESLVATKAYRIRQVVGHRIFSEFGLRRAQGLGAVMASRASCIGGADSTSNVLAAKEYDIPPSGTQAHSWIQSFDNELEAFRTYAEIHGNDTILLVDTYDTLRSGIPNAITVAREMEAKGDHLKGIRLDSGDLAYFSKKTRKMLDEAGLDYVMIVASNQLNEQVIQSLLYEQDAPIDAFGVGTELVSGKPDAALDGVYKLAEIQGLPRMKISENLQKVTLPGNKKLIRFLDSDGMFFRDGIFLENETLSGEIIIHHPIHPEKSTNVTGLRVESLLQPVFLNGKSLVPDKNPAQIHLYLKERIALLPVEHQRFVRPHIYKTGISKELLQVRNRLMNNAGKSF